MPRQKKQVLKQRKDGRYCAVYKGIQFMSTDHDEALRLRQEYIDNEKAGIGKVMTVKEYAQKWLPIAYPAVSDSTYHQLAIHLEKLTDALGNEKLSDVKPSQIKEIYSTRYLGLSDSYIKAARQLYCAFFDAAMADGYCRTNPARDKAAKPHKGTVDGHRAITDQERWWIKHYCTDHRAHAAVMAMLYAGIRPQEAKALDIDKSVDFDSNTITLVDFAHLKDSNHYEINQTGKTDKAARKIPLFPPLRKALKDKHGYLVTSASGGMVTIQAWKSVWESYVSSMETAINGCQERWYGKTKEHKKILAAGETLPEWKKFTVVPYDLRHSFCTMCRDNGVELNTCIKWMGHADAKMILKIYDEVSDDRSAREAEKLNSALFHMQNDMQDVKYARSSS